MRPDGDDRAEDEEPLITETARDEIMQIREDASSDGEVREAVRERDVGPEWIDRLLATDELSGTEVAAIVDDLAGVRPEEFTFEHLGRKGGLKIPGVSAVRAAGVLTGADEFEPLDRMDEPTAIELLYGIDRMPDDDGIREAFDASMVEEGWEIDGEHWALEPAGLPARLDEEGRIGDPDGPAAMAAVAAQPGDFDPDDVLKAASGAREGFRGLNALASADDLERFDELGGRHVVGRRCTTATTGRESSTRRPKGSASRTASSPSGISRMSGQKRRVD